MLVAALALLLPLPIPFTNSFPAWTILLVAAGLLERDGAFVLAGYVVFAAGVLYFVFLLFRVVNACLCWLRSSLSFFLLSCRHRISFLLLCDGPATASSASLSS
jgi:hypothetical protein